MVYQYQWASLALPGIEKNKNLPWKERVLSSCPGSGNLDLAPVESWEKYPARADLSF